ncbi:HAD family hydrolase [Chitinimonas lacunae]|uniref:HAD family hydrolase n=1 Tax=Chitinimonas lacunae TaxID=1963018 RepID=A0ABV8MLF9_9NEIS
MKLDFPIAAVLFDMDGLMLDSERAVLRAWRQAAREHGHDFDDSVLHAMVGLHDRLCRAMLLERFGPDLPIDAIFARTEALYLGRIEAGIPLKPGLTELLDWLDAVRLPKAVATSSTRQRAQGNLRSSGLLPRFPVSVCGDEIEQPKPAPDIYLKAADLLGVAPAHCIVLEDSEPGVQAALAAGMTPIQIPDIKPPSTALRALGHRIVGSLGQAHSLLREAVWQRTCCLV